MVMLMAVVKTELTEMLLLGGWRTSGWCSTRRLNHGVNVGRWRKGGKIVLDYHSRDCCWRESKHDWGYLLRAKNEVDKYNHLYHHLMP